MIKRHVLVFFWKSSTVYMIRHCLYYQHLQPLWKKIDLLKLVDLLRMWNGPLLFQVVLQLCFAVTTVRGALCCHSTCGLWWCWGGVVQTGCIMVASVVCGYVYEVCHRKMMWYGGLCGTPSTCPIWHVHVHVCYISTLHSCLHSFYCMWQCAQPAVH